MVSKKFRPRRTADKMASYKEKINGVSGQGSRASTPRKSPRNKTSKAQREGDTCLSLDDSTDRSSRSCQKVPSDHAVKKKDQGNGICTSKLESAVETPETPPREMRVAGRKRALAPQTLRFGTDASQDDTEESQMPSKKRKAFNSPSHGGIGTSQGSSPDDDDPGFDEDLTLLPQTGHLRDHAQDAILDMDPFDPGVDSPPAPLSFHGTKKVSEKTRQAWTSGKKKVVEEVRGLYRQQKSDLREITSSITTPLFSEVRDMRGVLEMLSNGTKSSSYGKCSSKTLLTEWEDKLNLLTPKAEVIFSKEVFARIICFNAPLKIYEVYKKCIQTDAGKASTAVQTLLFSHQPSSKKDDFSDGNGKLYSEFKYAVLQNTFYNVCKDTFDLFRSPLSPEEPTNGAHRRRSGQNCRLNRPGWLQVGYVTVDHINDVRCFMESLNQSRKSKIRRTPSPDDIANHGVLRAYRQLGSHLHKGRDYMRSSFFQGLGYIFVPRKDYVSDNDQRKMKLRFSDEDDNGGLNLDDIPSTELCSFAADADKSNEVDAANRNLLKTMFSDWPGMVLYVEHDVHVTRGSGVQRKRTGGERKTLRRLINLIEVACDVLVEYTRVGSIDTFLRGHNHVLRFVMVFAFLVKELTVEFINMRNTMEKDPDDPEKTVPDPLDVIIHDTCLKIFLPGKSIQGSYLSGRCLRFGEKVHDMCNVEEGTNGLCGTTSGDVIDATEITESDELGVATI